LDIRPSIDSSFFGSFMILNLFGIMTGITLNMTYHYILYSLFPKHMWLHPLQDCKERSSVVPRSLWPFINKNKEKLWDDWVPGKYASQTRMVLYSH
jgi:hypothetical protein